MPSKTVKKTPAPVSEPVMTYTERMCQQFTDDSYEKEDIQTMIRNFSKAETAKKHSDSTKMTFGKYNQKSIKDIVAFDRQYLAWLTKQTIMENFPELKNNIQIALN